MGLVIGIASKKGGTGKTTVAMNLAGALQEHLPDVAVVDSDPQGSTLTWRAAAGDNNFPVQILGMAQAIIHNEVPKLSQKYDALVIDSPSGYQDERWYFPFQAGAREKRSVEEHLAGLFLFYWNDLVVVHKEIWRLSK